MASRGCMLDSALEHGALQDAHVLVAAPRASDENSRTGMRFGVAASPEDRMRRFYGRQNALALGAFGERIQRLLVGRRFVRDPPALHEKSVFRTDTRIIESGGYRMRFAYLAKGVLQNQRIAPLQHARGTERQGGRIVAETGAAAARFHAEQLHPAVVEKRMKQPDRVGSAAHAGNRHR